ncbi:hypothetical protein NPX13_g3348 [Xylaria arbuscula]|uniref:Rad4/PNGase transglutaminase-like fold domain-containing protein n=1 Tax=Xylaria arbuscula TaxID=114810 RepID=A0A9W8NIQ2_9PEZI|nr:hypothetical protein NPX13_g3348 [Xylaria arbuscula]
MSTTEYLPTRIASRVTELSAILRRGHATQRWPNPERSIGRFICKVGKESIWEAQGEARRVFEPIAADIKTYLDRCVEPIPSWVTWSMYMIGSAAESASPTIVFCCEAIAHRRDVRTTIKQSGILNRYPGVKTAHMPKPPGFDHLIPLAPSSSDNKSTVQLQLSQDAPGMSLVITGPADGQQSSCRATIGGVIRVGSTYFYTTAAHPFQTHLDIESPPEYTASENQSNGDTEDDTCSFDGDSETAFELDDKLSSLATVTAGANIASAYGSQYPSGVKEQEVLEHATRENNNRIMVSRPTEPTVDYETPLGFTPFIEDLAFEYSGSFILVSHHSSDVKADFALLEATDSRHKVQNIVPSRSSSVTVSSLYKLGSLDAPVTYVLAITSRENIEGKLSGTPLYTRTPYDKAFQKMLCATFSGSLERGDCGAWVVDRDTGDLYGHIVAGTPGLGAALIEPFDDIFEFIRYRTGYKPVFPTNTVKFDHLESFQETSELRAGDAPSVPRGDDKKSIHWLIEDNKSQNGTRLSSDHGEPKETNYNHTTIAVREVIKGIEPHISRFELNPREGRRFTKLVYPALLYSNGDDFGWPSYSRFLSRLSDQSARDSHDFCSLLSLLSRTPLLWQCSVLLDEALNIIPIGQIHHDAKTDFDDLKANAMSLGTPRPDWGYQDCLVWALMRWFRTDYFTWVSSPACEYCLHTTVSRGETSRTPGETGAVCVELYQCTNSDCARITRFPRYMYPWALMETCRGRVAEWVLVFGSFCYAIGTRTRWVWSAEGYLWVEVYSKHVARWVHVDVIEGVWDDPVLYSERWGKALSYCVAFSAEGAVDVTRRYVREEKLLKPRNKCSELTLFYMLKKITVERRNMFTKEDQVRLQLEEAAEQRELQTLRVLSLTNELIDSLAMSPESQIHRNIPLTASLKEKWFEDTRKLIDEYFKCCETEHSTIQQEPNIQKYTSLPLFLQQTTLQSSTITSPFLATRAKSVEDTPEQTDGWVRSWGSIVPDHQS